MKHRAEIDGLRALAVLAVVGFHARLPGFHGGFAGVDVFLVISGYLIGGLILGEFSDGRFSLIGFYERRVRRILPALLAMLAVSLLAGFILFLPSDFRRFGAGLAAAVAMLSNALLARGGGYFHPNADADPLLHTWSLAVEEQFYLVFPPLLLLASRLGAGATRIVMAAGALLSLAYSVWAVGSHPTLAFYSPASRAWEFLAGSLLASGLIRRPPGRDVGDGAAVTGLALLGLTLWRLSSASAFPGVNAIPVVLGTVLLLYGAQAEGSRIARLLSLRPLVVIGLISYSLYLWHWPMIVFGGYYALDEAQQSVMRIVMALLAFPVAWLSWRYVERPFRKPRLALTRPTLFIGAAQASLVLLITGAAIHALNGLPARFSPVVQRLVDVGNRPDYGCTNRPIGQMIADPGCRFGDPAQPPELVVWGDSHAGMYLPALRDLARAHGVSGHSLATFGCPPLAPGRQVRRQPDAANCLSRNAEVLGLLSTHPPRAVLLAARWDAYDVESRRPGRRAGKRGDVLYDRSTFEAGVRMLRDRGITVYVALEVPSADSVSVDTLAKARIIGATRFYEPTMAGQRPTAATRAFMLDLQRQRLIRVIDPASLLCGPRRCLMTAGDYPLYYDSNHLNARGARFVGPLFDPMFRDIAAQEKRISRSDGPVGN